MEACTTVRDMDIVECYNKDRGMGIIEMEITCPEIKIWDGTRPHPQVHVQGKHFTQDGD